jgi:hypothetical protein
MNESLEVIVEMIAIVSFCCGVVNYTVIKPLRASIDLLAAEVRELKKVLDEIDDEVSSIRTDVTVNKNKLSALEGRVTHLEGYHTQPINGGKP